MNSILATGRVQHHKAVSAYLSLWQLRANYLAVPIADAELALFPGRELSKDEEENLEKAGVIYMRGSAQGVAIPARLMRSVQFGRHHYMNVQGLKFTRWSVAHAAGTARFMCPDNPAGHRYMPITPQVALIGTEHRSLSLLDPPALQLPDEQVDALNHRAYETCFEFVFGFPTDADAFLASVLANTRGSTRPGPTISPDETGGTDLDR